MQLKFSVVLVSLSSPFLLGFVEQANSLTVSSQLLLSCDSSACQLMCDIDLQPLLGADEISEVLTVAGCLHTTNRSVKGL
jgi:hypothetical protein